MLLVLVPLIHFIPDSLTYSVPLFLKRQCDRTLGAAAADRRDGGVRPPRPGLARAAVEETRTGAGAGGRGSG